jgi:hypothetical protein
LKDVIRLQVKRGFRRRDDAEIESVFHKYATSSSGPGSVHHIKKDRLLVALKEFDASIGDITREDVSREDAIFRSLDRNGDGILDLSEFKQAVKTPSALEEWAQSLPLAQLLVDAIPKKVGRDHLRVTSGLTTEDVDEVCDGFSAGLRRILNESVGQLKAAFESMDRARENPAGGKFRVDLPPNKLRCGSIEDFHKGLSSRIGDMHNILSLQVYLVASSGCFRACSLAIYLQMK